jgi:hypothetical protein
MRIKTIENETSLFSLFTFHRNIEQITFLHQEIEMHAIFHVHKWQIERIYNVQ